MDDRDREVLAGLPSTFRFNEALRIMNERRFRSLVRRGAVVRLAHGLYRKPSAGGDEDLIEIAAQRPKATLCLRSALARHDLIDDIPARIDIALPRGGRPFAATAPVTWHTFDVNTFERGRELLELDEVTAIGLYDAERSIIDAFRLRHSEGVELANEALKTWLRRTQRPGDIMRMAADFPQAAPALRHSLEILL